MNEEGRNVKKTVQQVRTLCKNIGLLPQTVDDLMINEGWKPYKATAVDGSSLFLHYPERWVPSILYRVHFSHKYPQTMAFVSVLLDDDFWGGYQIEEPVISAGFYDYGRDITNKKNDEWDYKWIRLYSYAGNNSNDWTIPSFTQTDIERWIKKCPCKNAKCFGLPLILVTNRTDIASMICNPLLKSIKSHYGIIS